MWEQSFLGCIFGWFVNDRWLIGATRVGLFDGGWSLFLYRNRASLLYECEVIVDCSCRYIDGLWIGFAYEVGELYTISSHRLRKHGLSVSPFFVLERVVVSLTPPPWWVQIVLLAEQGSL